MGLKPFKIQKFHVYAKTQNSIKVLSVKMNSLIKTYL